MNHHESHFKIKQSSRRMTETIRPQTVPRVKPKKNTGKQAFFED